MKKFVLLSMVSVALVLSAGSGCNCSADSMRVAEDLTPPTITGGKGTVLKDNVNVRARADKNSEVIAQLKKGDIVDVRERKGEWLRIAAPSSAKCFVASKFIKDGEITADSINARCGAGTSFHEIGKLSKGEKVQVVGTKNDWTQIKPTTHCTGWVAAELIDVAAPTPIPAAPIQTSEAPLLAPIVTPTPVQVTDNVEEVHIQYVVKDGYLAVVKEASAPGAYALMTEDVMGRQYIIAYLSTTQTNLSRFEGKHVRILGNQRWKRSDRYPVITVDRCEIVL